MVWQTSASLRGNCLGHRGNPSFLYVVVQNTIAAATESREYPSHFEIIFKPMEVLTFILSHTAACFTL